MARRRFVIRGVRLRNGDLAAGTTYVAYTDTAGTVPADISDSSGGSSLAGSAFTLGSLGDYDLYGPPAGTDTLYFRCPADPTLGVQRYISDPDERLDALEAGGGGGVTDHGALTGLADDDHPQYETSAEAAAKVTAHEAAVDPHAGYELESAHTLAAHDALGLATDAELATHAGAADPHPGYMTAAETAAVCQPLDSDLTAVAALTPSNDDVIQRKGGVWVARSMAQVKTDLALAKTDVGLGNVDNAAAGPFPQTFDGSLATGSINVASSNNGFYMLVTEGPVQSITSLVVLLATSSGNISVAVYSSTGSGRSRAPATRLATSGAVAAPGTGERTISLGGSVTVTPFETWFFISADNTSASFHRATTSDSAILKGLVAFQATAHPAPTSAGALTAGSTTRFWIAGV